MKIILEKQAREALNYFNQAQEVALKSSCLRSRCGCVIVKNNEIIGQGYNSPPQNKAVMACQKDNLPNDFKSDRTCCVHAEQRAIMDALKNNPNKIIGSSLYFIRIDEKGEKTFSGDPYYTICSKMALDVGVAEFILFREQGICVYDTEEYNNLSFKYVENNN